MLLGTMYNNNSKNNIPFTFTYIKVPANKCELWVLRGGRRFIAG